MGLTKQPNFCCSMREKYLIGIVAEDLDHDDPPDLVDFLDFSAKTSQGKPILRIRFCPFCGMKMTQQYLRALDPPIPEFPGDEWKGERDE